MSPQTTLPQDEVHLWTASLYPADSLLSRAESTLSPEELQRAAGFRLEIDRQKYLICHLKLREILSTYANIPARDLRFTPNPFGKPALPAETTGDNLDFNLSHSGDRMLLGIVRNARIGVDIERLRPEFATMEVAARFFTERENETLRSLSGDCQVQAFFNCWTRKEAYLKALGCGLSIEPNQVQVTLMPGEKPEITRHTNFEERNPWSLFHVSDGEYTAAVAIDRPSPRFRLFQG